MSFLKITVALTLALNNAVHSFTPTRTQRYQTISIQMKTDAEHMVEIGPEKPEDMIPLEPQMSQSMPFMKRPKFLTGALAGDVGFDPLGFSKSESELMNYREAEIKHARLAMLAAAGWPLSEVFDKKIAVVIGMTPMVDSSDRAPSVLNGGLGKISPLYWIACIGISAAIDLYGIQRRFDVGPDYVPGDLNFDPLGIFPSEKEGKERMQLAEIKNGRLAMIAVTAFAVQEAVLKVGVVDETPFFFFPVMSTLQQWENSGYVQ